jgi:hypothetical protein
VKVCVCLSQGQRSAVAWAQGECRDVRLLTTDRKERQSLELAVKMEYAGKWESEVVDPWNRTAASDAGEICWSQSRNSAAVRAPTARLDQSQSSGRAPGVQPPAEVRLAGLGRGRPSLHAPPGPAGDRTEPPGTELREAFPLLQSRGEHARPSPSHAAGMALDTKHHLTVPPNRRPETPKDSDRLDNRTASESSTAANHGDTRPEWQFENN